MPRSVFLFAAAAGLLASPAIAADPQATQQPAAANASNPDQKICEKITVTGSRLATRTVCATKREWDQRRLEERAADRTLPVERLRRDERQRRKGPVPHLSVAGRR